MKKAYLHSSTLNFKEIEVDAWNRQINIYLSDEINVA